MILPADWDIYSRDVITRCENLIKTQIWSGIDPLRLKRWLNNFKSDEEKYFCACILDTLIYRSEDQTISLLKQMFQRTVHDIDKQKKLPIAISDWEMELRVEKLTKDPLVRFIPVCRKEDQPHKSGFHVARLFKRNLRIHPQLVENHTKIPELRAEQRVNTFIFIDDFLGTGMQFIEFWQKEGLEKSCDGAYVAYLPIAGHIKGIEEIKRNYPDIVVSPVEVLTDKHCIFNCSSGYFEDEENCTGKIKNFYYNLLQDRGIPQSARRGWGNLELAYIFSHAAPDNTLPIFWWYDSPNWQPLFDR